MGIKSRGNYPVSICLKKCLNRNKFCNECIHYSNYMPILKNKWMLISYYTPNYEEPYKMYLKPSLEKLPSIPTHIEILLKDFNNWEQATNYKPKFIQKCLEVYDCDLVITDVDSTINKYPILFTALSDEYKGHDIAIHNFQWQSHYGRSSDKGKSEMLSGTLYLKNNDKIKELVRLWIENLMSFSWEQKALEKALKQMPEIKIYNLPRSYCYINSCPPNINNGQVAVPIKDPIISHYQYSRIAKRRK